MPRLRNPALAFVAGLAATAVIAVPSATSATSDTIVTAAGNGSRGTGGDGRQASEAQLNQPRSIFATPDGGFVWAEPYSNEVRKVGPDGVVSVVAGTGTAGFTGDGGPATKAEVNFVHSAVPTADGGYVIADIRNNRIRRISPKGIITTIAGTGAGAYSGDGGPATKAAINDPRGVAVMPDGSILIPDSDNQRVRKIAPDGIITTVAGTGVQGFSGDGGPATSAELSIPFGVAPTPDGGFLIDDVGNQRIRKVSPDGIITTVAGNGSPGFSGDGGPATDAMLYNPHNVVALPDGGFLIADTSNLRVRRVDANGIITTIAGTGGTGFSGDGGPATQAQIAYPKAVALTRSGAILVADEQNNRIRYIGVPVAPRAMAAPTISGAVAPGQTLQASSGRWRGTGPTFTYQWQRCHAGKSKCTDLSRQTGSTYRIRAADFGSSLRVKVLATNVSGKGAAISTRTGLVSRVSGLTISLQFVPSPPRAGTTVTVIYNVKEGSSLVLPSKMACSARAGGKPLAPFAKALPGLAMCAYNPPRTAKGKTFSGTVGFTVRGTRFAKRFSARLR